MEALGMETNKPYNEKAEVPQNQAVNIYLLATGEKAGPKIWKT